MKVSIIGKHTNPRSEYMVYLSDSPFRRMSSIEFIEKHLGIRLFWYQKIILYSLDMYLRFEKYHMPSRYYLRIANEKDW